MPSVLYDHTAVKAEGGQAQDIDSFWGVPCVPGGQGATVHGSACSVQEQPRLSKAGVTADLETRR